MVIMCSSSDETGNEEQKSKRRIKSKKLRFRDIYELGEEIGKGSTATVFRCFKRKGDGKTNMGMSFAVKIIDKKKVAAMYNNIYQQLKREVDILDKLRHPHIIRLYGMFESEKVLRLRLTSCQNRDELTMYLGAACCD